VGWVSTIGEDAVIAYCRVPPHGDTVPQSAEEGRYYGSRLYSR